VVVGAAVAVAALVGLVVRGGDAGPAAAAPRQVAGETPLESPAQAFQRADRVGIVGRIFPLNPEPRCAVVNGFGGPSGVYGAGGHQGIDIAAPLGTEVYAVEAGVLGKQYLAATSANAGNGWSLKGDSGDSYRYYHLSEFAPGLATGSRVTRGQVIGYVGSTGNAYGVGNYHLHFEIHPGDGVAVDPLPLLPVPASCPVS
jgi:murein DD-endopeptidase MepM/ murein hydrolase activator NlpD